MGPCSVADINAQGFFVPHDPHLSDRLPERRAKGGLREDFMWGFATAAAQIEGGGQEKEKASGRGRSVCTLFAQATPRDAHLPAQRAV